MTDAGFGVYELAADAGAGDDYRFVIDGGEPLPDPATRWQPEGLRGPSRVLDLEPPRPAARRCRRPTSSCSTSSTSGRSAGEGTFAGAIPHLARAGGARRERDRDHAGGRVPRARAAGATTASTLSAAQSSYGGPEGLRELVGRRPRGRAGGDPRRRLQPRRRLRGHGAGGVRAVLHREVRDPVGTGDQLRRRRVRRGPRVGAPERRRLGRGLRDRRAAPRRHPRDLRLLAGAHRRRDRSPRARGRAPTRW